MNDKERQRLCKLVDEYAKEYSKLEYERGWLKGYLVGVSITFVYWAISMIINYVVTK